MQRLPPHRGSSSLQGSKAGQGQGRRRVRLLCGTCNSSCSQVQSQSQQEKAWQTGRLCWQTDSATSKGQPAGAHDANARRSWTALQLAAALCACRALLVQLLALRREGLVRQGLNRAMCSNRNSDFTGCCPCNPWGSGICSLGVSCTVQQMTTVGTCSGESGCRAHLRRRRWPLKRRRRPPL